MKKNELFRIFMYQVHHMYTERIKRQETTNLKTKAAYTETALRTNFFFKKETNYKKLT